MKNNVIGDLAIEIALERAFLRRNWRLGYELDKLRSMTARHISEGRELSSVSLCAQNNLVSELLMRAGDEGEIF